MTLPPIKTFLFVALIAVVVSVVGILLLRNDVRNDGRNLVSPTPVPIPSPQPQAVNTDNWQTYRNEEFGLELKYPRDWKVLAEGEKGLSFGQEGVVPAEETGTGEKVPVTAVGMTISIYSQMKDLPDNRNNLSLEGWIMERYGKLQDSEREKIEEMKFGAEYYQGWKVEIFKELGVTAIVPRVYLENSDGAIFGFEGLTPSLPVGLAKFPKEYDYYKTFYQILSTLRFVGEITISDLEFRDLPMGIIDNNPPPSGLSFSELIYTNKWRDYVGEDLLITVYAGSLVEDLAQGAILVQVAKDYGIKGMFLGAENLISTPRKSGAVKIIEAKRTILKMVAENGDTFLFDATTQKFTSP